MFRSARHRRIAATLALAISLAMLPAGALGAKRKARTVGTTISACYRESGGAVRFSTTRPKCKRGETLLSWNTVGPAGLQGPRGEAGPSGVQGVAGVKGETGATGAPGAAG